jgi:hypothetical protein
MFLLMKMFDWYVIVGRALLGYKVLHLNGRQKNACCMCCRAEFYVCFRSYRIESGSWCSHTNTLSYVRTYTLSTDYYIFVHTYISHTYTYVGLYGTPQLEQMNKIYRPGNLHDLEPSLLAESMDLYLGSKRFQSSGLENREYGCRDPSRWSRDTSPTSCGR